VFNAHQEGLSYSETDTGEPAPQQTSRAQAAQIINHLSLPNSEQKTVAPGELTPRRDEVERLRLSQEPVETYLAASRTRQLDRPLLWSILCLLAVLLLATQWAWFQKDLYSLNPKWRPWYITACQYLHCQLPEYAAIEKIQTERLAVKSHTEYRNVLVVELVIRNRAAWPQPMPALDLVFYDINGAVLASRVIAPEEYLSRDSSLEKIPVQTPVHLSFSIIDPGPEAVNYDIRLTADTST